MNLYASENDAVFHLSPVFDSKRLDAFWFEANEGWSSVKASESFPFELKKSLDFKITVDNVNRSVEVYVNDELIVTYEHSLNESRIERVEFCSVLCDLTVNETYTSSPESTRHSLVAESMDQKRRNALFYEKPSSD